MRPTAQSGRRSCDNGLCVLTVTTSSSLWFAECFHGDACVTTYRTVCEVAFFDNLQSITSTQRAQNFAYSSHSWGRGNVILSQ